MLSLNLSVLTAVVQWANWREGQHDWPEGASEEEVKLFDLAKQLRGQKKQCRASWVPGLLLGGPRVKGRCTLEEGHGGQHHYPKDEES